MPTINTVDNFVFEYEGVNYPKTFVAVNQPAGNANVRIQNLYDSRLVLQEATDFNNYTVDGNNVWADVAALMAAVQPILSGTVVQAQTFAALTDTDVSGIASDDVLQWNGTHWENRAELMLSDTLRISEIAPSINFTGVVGNVISDNEFTLTISTGDINLNAGAGAVINLNGPLRVDFVNSGIRAIGLPTSAAGLSSGDLWVDTAANDVLKRVP